MARRRSNASGALIIGLLILAGIIWLFSEHRTLAYLLFVGVPLGLIVIAIGAARPQHCGVCNTELKRSVLYWTIDGVQTKVCANCARGLERKLKRKKSAEALTNIEARDIAPVRDLTSDD